MLRLRSSPVFCKLIMASQGAIVRRFCLDYPCVAVIRR